jgi:uncharacterized repeat protein (TIGR01451 family)
VRVGLGGSDVTVVKHVSLASAYPGRRIIYTLNVSNLGPAEAANVNVTDTASLGLKVLSVHARQGGCHSAPPITCSLGTLAAGKSTTITVIAEAKQAGTEVNAASATSASGDSDPANNLSSAKTRLSPVLRLTKTASTGTAHAGQTVNYRIKVANPTDLAIKKVKVCDRLPSGLIYTGSSPHAHLSNGRYCWSITKLGAGRSKRFTLTVNVEPGPGGRSVNHATATAHGVRGANATAAVRVSGVAPIPCGIASGASVSHTTRRNPIARIAC